MSLRMLKEYSVFITVNLVHQNKSKDMSSAVVYDTKMFKVGQKKNELKQKNINFNNLLV